MAATNEVNFNSLEGKDYIKDCLSSGIEDLCYNQASLYNGDCSVESAANVLRSNIGTWEWTSLPVEPIYKPYTAANDFMEGESMDEVIKRIVREAVKELTEGVDAINVPEIEKYQIKHR
jgi:hypothetical protein